MILSSHCHSGRIQRPAQSVGRLPWTPGWTPPGGEHVQAAELFRSGPDVGSSQGRGEGARVRSQSRRQGAGGWRADLSWHHQDTYVEGKQAGTVAVKGTGRSGSPVPLAGAPGPRAWETPARRYQASARGPTFLQIERVAGAFWDGRAAATRQDSSPPPGPLRSQVTAPVGLSPVAPTNTEALDFQCGASVLT